MTDLRNERARERSLSRQLEEARAFLEQAMASLPEDRWAERPNDVYSPVGWHVGHVAAIEARFLLGVNRFPLFDPFRTEKESRTRLPPPAELRSLLAEVSALVDAADSAPPGNESPAGLGLPPDFLVRYVAQHELQHAEHIQVIAALCKKRLHKMAKALPLRRASRIERPGGPAMIGSDDAAEASDNERCRHEVLLAPHWIDRAPVSVTQFREFVEAGGYRALRFWTREGWAWVQSTKARAPFGFEEQHAEAPVSCVSWFEADAYARFRGSRLPTEQEFEAAHLSPMGVWEWTSSWFEPYPGFRPYPYDGYSTPWFNQTHRVLRGASWATAERLQRPSFRNWYEPGFREIPSGFRCAGDL